MYLVYLKGGKEDASINKQDILINKQDISINKWGTSINIWDIFYCLKYHGGASNP